MRNVKQGDRISGRSPNRSDRECFRHAAATRVLKLLSGLGFASRQSGTNRVHRYTQQRKTACSSAKLE